MTDEEKDLFVRCQYDDMEAMELLIKKYNNLVKKLAYKYSIDPFQYEDNYQNGMIGLFLAIKQYDLDFDTKFLTYAFPIVRNAILRGKFAFNPYISINIYAYNNFKIMNEFIDDYYKKYHCKPTKKEIMKHLSWSIKTFNTINNLNYIFSPISIGEDYKEFNILSEAINVDMKSTEDIALENIFVEDIYNIIRKYVSEKDLTMYRLHCGLWDNKMYTYKEIGKIFGISSQAAKYHIDKVTEISKGPVLEYIKKSECGE